MKAQLRDLLGRFNSERYASAIEAARASIVVVRNISNPDRDIVEY
jgi:hypothetical protein